MTVSLDVAAPEVAVLRGVDSQAALAHLCRSLVTGSVFDAYRALVIDLDGFADLEPEATAALERAGAACQERRQWLAVAPRHDDVEAAVAQARAWLRLVEPRRARRTASDLLGMNARLVAGVIRTGWDIATAIGRQASRLATGDEGPRDSGRSTS